ncbi:DUF5011 domain-containing protein [Enterococcus ureilyticus]|uniref:immunoglobulin-like domain-containing protein n=1 Tax=Enterococcus ureilyticus TaxID=1131292 RepID=UPI001A92D7CE|nr:immunoglobulin-like domain-containing protein [Enterococcus ureilyticus]MBO0447052.1 DUF5011 domain-containing protein [Enterococcus ureilyticus]
MKKKKILSIIAISLLATQVLSPTIGVAESTVETQLSEQDKIDTTNKKEEDVASRLTPMNNLDSENVSINLVSDTITLNVGDTFNPAEYATATNGSETIPYDENGYFVDIVNLVDTTTPGTYQVVYRVHCSDGIAVDKTLTVIVQEKEADTNNNNLVSDNVSINLVSDTKTLNVGDSFDPAEYATATNGSETIPYDENGYFLAIMNQVDTTTPGTYQVVYRVHCSDGIAVDKTLTVIVQNKATEPSEKASIEASDKTMYVGDKLTENDILNWATFNNAEELTVGFKVLGEDIPVYKVDNTLAKVGMYKIQYYIEDENEKVIAEKEITLTVLETNANTTEMPPSNTTESSEAISTGDEGNQLTTKKMKDISDGEKTFPRTGETKSPLLIEFGIMALLASAYILNKKISKVN